MQDEVQNGARTRERNLFLDALERTDAQERAAFLDQACAASPGLRQRIEELLAQQEHLGNFLQTPVLGPGSHSMAGVTEKPGDRIGRYKLLQKIGEGGAGVVYMAEQEQPVRRRVALKVIKLGMDTKNVMARFEAERQALAMMEHPNIAKVFDAGATEAGRPFFVMELVRGIKINEYCDEHHLLTRQRLGLFIQVCQAIQHAHQKGIIHRDVKPSNILVTLHDGTPVPKVIDFGIAKATQHRLTEKTLFTEFTTFIGTPAYMSPEQAEMSGLDVDTRSDIYALGVLLYELLTGKTPFDAEALMKAGLDECRRTIREKEPPAPSTRLQTLAPDDLTTTAQQRQLEAPKLIHQLSGDLDWIAMKCLEKDRGRRYPTANDLIADIERYLNGEPVLARPPSSVYRFRKFVRRHRGVFAATTAVAITLVTGAGLSAWQAVRAIRAERIAEAAQRKEAHLRLQAERERARAEQQKAAAHLNEYVADINLAQQSLAAGNYGRAMQLLKKHHPPPGGTDLRGFEWRYLWQVCQGDAHASLPRQESGIESLAFSRQNNLLAVGLRDKTKIFDAPSQNLLTNFPKGGISMAFFPDGKGLVSASPNTTRIWSTVNWTEQKAWPNNSGLMAMAQDGKRLATVSWEGVSVLDTTTWTETRFLSRAFGPIGFSPDGKSIAADTREGLTVWSLQNSNSMVVLQDSTNLFGRGGFWFRTERLFGFSADGQLLVAARNTLSDRGVFVLSIWDTQSGQEVAVMPSDPEHIEHTGVISALAFSPDGRTLATASMDHSIRLWDFASRKRIATFQGHLNEVWTVTFSPDGQTLASGAKDGSVKLWPLHQQKKEDVLAGVGQPLSFSKDGRSLALLGRQNTLHFLQVTPEGTLQRTDRQFNLDNPTQRGPFRPPPLSLGLSADLLTVAQGLSDGNVKIWDTQTGEATVLKAASRFLDLLALSPDASSLIIGERGRSPRWWDLQTGTNMAMQTQAHRVLFSPDGKTLAAFARANTIEIWDVASRSMRTSFEMDVPAGFAAAFSPDGSLLAVVCFDDSVRLFNTISGAQVGTCTGHKQAVFSVAFAPDGNTLATASEDSTLKLWNVGTQQELLSLRRLGGALRNIVFSPDGRWLVVGRSSTSAGGSLCFYKAPLFSEIDGLAEQNSSGK